MTAPAYVRLVTAVTSALFLIPGCRDIFAPGVALPFPGDAKMMEGLYKDVNKASLEGRKMLFFSNCLGVFIVTLATAKAVTMLTNPEGTFLRRNLMFVFGFTDLLLAACFQKHAALFADLGTSVGPYKVLLLIHGSVLLFDAIARKRTPKSAGKKKK